MSETKKHWDTVYTTKGPEEVSWFQPYPHTSVRLIEELGLPADAAIIDVGGGDAALAEALLDKGFTNLHVLDISAVAIERAKRRLGEKAEQIRWIVSDVTEFEPQTQYAVWHDRAAFHFLTEDAEVRRYLDVVSGGVKAGGYMILATFSEKGPLKCSGLAISQYDEEKIQAVFSGPFQCMACMREDHETPFGTTQNFLFCTFQRRY